MKISAKKMFSKLNHYFDTPSINLWKTILFNFLMLPFKEAIKLPIVIYGSCSFGSITGSVRLLSKAHYGMLKIGTSDPVRSKHSKSYLNIEGVLEIDEDTTLRRGIRLRIAKGGTLRLCKSAYIGDNNTMIATCLIEIGHSVRVGNNTTFMDTDFHYIINTVNREVKYNIKPIIIGENCWIGGWCTIKKGTILPKGTIVAGPYSMTSKDYTKTITQCSLIAGSPAKVILEGMRRINNWQSDIEVDNFYKHKEGVFVLQEDRDLDKFCMPNI